MKKTLFILLIILIISCNNDDNSQSDDPIIGTWTELGCGNVLDNDTVEFTEYDYFCVTLGRFTFENNGNFRIETFDGPDDGCFSTGILTGTWENLGDTYLFRIITDTSDEPEEGEEGNIKIEFPSNNRMQWIYEVNQNGIDYEFFEFTKIE